MTCSEIANALLIFTIDPRIAKLAVELACLVEGMTERADHEGIEFVPWISSFLLILMNKLLFVAFLCMSTPKEGTLSLPRAYYREPCVDLSFATILKSKICPKPRSDVEVHLVSNSSMLSVRPYSLATCLANVG